MSGLQHASENLNRSLDTDLRVRKFGYLLVIFLILVIGTWSACAPLDSAALAPGLVQVEGKRKSIQHLEGGIVSNILVSNGDLVKINEPLLVLDATKDRAEQKILRGTIFSTQAYVDRLTAERDDLTSIQFAASVVSASEFDQRALTAMQSENSLFSVRLADLRGEESVIESRRKGLIAVSESKTAIVTSLATEISDLQSLLADGYVDQQRIRELERSEAQLIGELSDLRVSLEELDLQMLQLKKRFKTQVVSELTDASARLFDLQQQLSAVSDRVRRATVRSPVGGVVLNIAPNTIGAVVGSGEKLMEIVPQDKSLIVQARISPLDIDRVKVGNTAYIRFSVFKDAYTVSGSLSKVSADRLVDQKSDLPYYAAEVELNEDSLQLLEGMSLVPGMPAEVLIKTGTRTMLGYLTSPMNRVFARSLIED